MTINGRPYSSNASDMPPQGPHGTSSSGQNEQRRPSASLPLVLASRHLRTEAVFMQVRTLKDKVETESLTQDLGIVSLPLVLNLSVKGG